MEEKSTLKVQNPESNLGVSASSSSLSSENSPNDEVWWILARLKSVLIRLQESLLNQHLIAKRSTPMREVKEKINSMKDPSKITSSKNRKTTNYSIFTTVSGSATEKTEKSAEDTKEKEKKMQENIQNWSLISELCQRLEDVIKHGRELMAANNAQTFDRLAEYSFRAGSFIAQLILSESRTLEEVIIAIDELLNQYRQEISRELPQAPIDISRLPTDTSRGPPLTFKDLILQESEVLSVLSSFTGNSRLSAVQVGRRRELR